MNYSLIIPFFGWTLLWIGVFGQIDHLCDYRIQTEDTIESISQDLGCNLDHLKNLNPFWGPSWILTPQHYLAIPNSCNCGDKCLNCEYSLDSSRTQFQGVCPFNLRSVPTVSSWTNEESNIGSFGGYGEPIVALAQQIVLSQTRDIYAIEVKFVWSVSSSLEIRILKGSTYSGTPEETATFERISNGFSLFLLDPPLKMEGGHPYTLVINNFNESEENSPVHIATNNPYPAGKFFYVSLSNSIIFQDDWDLMFQMHTCGLIEGKSYCAKESALLVQNLEECLIHPSTVAANQSVTVEEVNTVGDCGLGLQFIKIQLNGTSETAFIQEDILQVCFGGDVVTVPPETSPIIIATTSSPKNSPRGFPWWIIIVILLVFLVIIILVIIIIRRRKKKDSNASTEDGKKKEKGLVFSDDHGIVVEEKSEETMSVPVYEKKVREYLEEEESMEKEESSLNPPVMDGNKHSSSREYNDISGESPPPEDEENETERRRPIVTFSEETFVIPPNPPPRD